ncbi:MAG: ribulose-phosphate 3-epimerase [Oscillospiraceae bacterium]
MYMISPSILSSDFSRLGEDAKKMCDAGADMLHIDVMDGHFVPNISFGSAVTKSIRHITDKIFDVHLMISEPLKYIDDFVSAGADIITFHIESDSDVIATIEKIKKSGKKVGLSIKPKTPTSAVIPYLPLVDMILVMTVEPGFGGQSFMEDMMPKLRELREQISQKNLDIILQVDGGISDKTIGIAAKNGADCFVAGSYLFKKDDYAEGISSLHNAIKKATC